MKRNQLRSGFAFARFEYTSTYIIHILNISIQAQPLQHMESCKMSRCSRLTVLMGEMSTVWVLLYFKSSILSNTCIAIRSCHTNRRMISYHLAHEVMGFWSAQMLCYKMIFLIYSGTSIQDFVHKIGFIFL